MDVLAWKEVGAIIVANGTVIIVIGWFIKGMVHRFEATLNGAVDRMHQNSEDIRAQKVRIDLLADQVRDEMDRAAENSKAIWQSIATIQNRCFDQLKSIEAFGKK